MARLTPQEFAEKQSRRLKASLEDVRAGINRVTVSPTMKAATKQDKMLAKTTEAIQSGRWAAGLKKVSLEEWKDKAANVGVNRIAAGIDAARPKVEEFAAQLLPAVDAAKAKIASMPDNTIEDSINRMNAYTREMAKFRKR